MSEKVEIAKKLKEIDPVKPNAEKGLEAVENSPMDPPDAYDDQAIVDQDSDIKLPEVIEKLKAEHWNAIEKINAFEKALTDLKASNFQFTDEINEELSSFFQFIDDDLIAHNNKEEKVLFPLLNERLLSTGEHSKEDIPKTAIDIMEDDHNKFLQLGALAFNLFGLAARLQDPGSKMFVFDAAYNNSRELIELLKLHIFREDNTLFPLAVKLIAEDEFFRMNEKFDAFNG